MLIDATKIRRFLITVVCAGALLSFFSYTAFAQDTDDGADIDPYVDGDLSVAKCLASGEVDFGIFLDAVIYNDGFYEGVIEPWVDVLMRNKCHATDVSGLIKQRDKIRTYIRDAFLTCDTDKVKSLKTAYYKVNAEIYYVRHVVDGSVVISLPYEFLSTRMLEDEESLYYPTEVLYSEMFERYVDTGLMAKNDFNLLFDKLEFKYRDRKKTYVICENDAFDQVADKWEDFVNSGAGTIPALKSFKKTVGGRAEKIVEAVTDMGLKAYLKGIIQINLNNMDLAQGFEEISQNISDYIPNAEFPTQSSLLQAIQIADRQYDVAAIEQNLSSNFEVLYKETSDASFSLLIDELSAFDDTISESLNSLDDILECSEVMNARQCPGKF